MNAGSSELKLRRILDWLEDRLSKDEASAIEIAVADGDEELRRSVAWLRAFLIAGEHIPLRSISPTVMGQLKQLFTNRGLQRDMALDLVRYDAILAADSAVGTHHSGARAGVSSSEQDSTRQLVYEADPADVVLNVAKHLNEIGIHGQVFPNIAIAPSELTVQLLRREANAGIASPNAQGNFSFINIQPDTYQIIVSADQFEIEIAPIALQL